MTDASQEILSLNSRIDSAKERFIRLQSRRENFIKNRESLIQEIRAAGYDPTTLRETRDKLKADLELIKQNLESELTKAENILKSIPETK